MQQQALKDFAYAKQARFSAGFGEPTWRKKHKHEGFRVIGTDRVPACRDDGTPLLNGKGKQVMSRSVVVRKLNKHWAQVKAQAADGYGSGSPAANRRTRKRFG